MLEKGLWQWNVSGCIGFIDLRGNQSDILSFGLQIESLVMKIRTISPNHHLMVQSRSLYPPRKWIEICQWRTINRNLILICFTPTANKLRDTNLVVVDALKPTSALTNTTRSAPVSSHRRGYAMIARNILPEDLTYGLVIPATPIWRY